MQSRLLFFGMTLVLTAIILTPASPLAAGDATKASIDSLGWIAGDWQTAPGGAQIEEHWIKPAAGTMFGVSRMIAGKKTVFFEFLRIEERADGTFYIAQPKGNPPTEFKLTSSSDGLAVFENPLHDNPKKITYRRNADGSVTATTEGDEDGKASRQDFHYFRMK